MDRIGITSIKSLADSWLQRMKLSEILSQLFKIFCCEIDFLLNRFNFFLNETIPEMSLD